MSVHANQKIRKLVNVSPVKFGPIRATKSFGQKSSPSTPQLNAGSPSWPSSDSRKWKLPEHNIACLEGMSDISSPSPIYTERPVKDKWSGTHSPVVLMRRSASFDTIATSYLCGEWPRPDVTTTPDSQSPTTTTSAEQTTAEKFTQTYDDLDEADSDSLKRRGSHRRTSSLTGVDPVKEIRARLCKSAREVVAGVRHASPVGCGAGTPHPPSSAINIPLLARHSPLMPCQGSAEGFNQEIEKLVRSTGILDADHDVLLKVEATPDGHRAPIADLLNNTRSVDTQTPSGGSGLLPLYAGGRMSAVDRLFLRIPEDGSCSDDSCGSQSRQESPACLAHLDSPATLTACIPRATDTQFPLGGRADSTDSHDDCNTDDDRIFPGPNVYFVKSILERQAPDGCERVEVKPAEEYRRDIYGELTGPVKVGLAKCHIPSEGSAFCPLLKTYVSQQTLLAFNLANTAAAGSASTGNNGGGIEA